MNERSGINARRTEPALPQSRADSFFAPPLSATKLKDGSLSFPNHLNFTITL